MDNEKRIRDVSEYTTVEWGNCQKVKKDFSFRGMITCSDEPTDSVYSKVNIPDWCPLKNEGEGDLYD